MIKHCPGCLRHTVTELVPATQHTTTNYINGTSQTTTETAVPPYRICTWCGWSFGYEETSA